MIGPDVKAAGEGDAEQSGDASTSGQPSPAQPAPPRNVTTDPGDPEREPNAGDPGPPILEPRTPEYPAEKLRGVPNVNQDE